MKISYSNYPALKLLKDDWISKFGFYEEDIEFVKQKFTDYVNDLKLYKSKFNSNINYVSDPFKLALHKSREKLHDLLVDILYEDKGDLLFSGTFIIGSQVYMIDYKKIENSDYHDFVVFGFDKNGMPLLYFKNIYSDGKIYFLWASQLVEFQKDEKGLEELCWKVLSDILCIHLFKTFSQIETKVLNPKTKLKDINCKYVNDTELKINHLDSTWYTNLIKSDAFKVNGHLRWQPKKVNGEWTKELIWIEDFTKSGYTRKAAKLSQDATSGA